MSMAYPFLLTGVARFIQPMGSMLSKISFADKQFFNKFYFLN